MLPPLQWIKNHINKRHYWIPAHRKRTPGWLRTTWKMSFRMTLTIWAPSGQQRWQLKSFSLKSITPVRQSVQNCIKLTGKVRHAQAGFTNLAGKDSLWYRYLMERPKLSKGDKLMKCVALIPRFDALEAPLKIPLHVYLFCFWMVLIYISNCCRSTCENILPFVTLCVFTRQALHFHAYELFDLSLFITYSAAELTMP